MKKYIILAIFIFGSLDQAVALSETSVGKGLGFIPKEKVKNERIEKGKRIAIILTIDTFKDSFFPALKWPEHDGESLKGKLLTGAGYEAITLPKTRTEVMKELKKISDRSDIQNATVLFYISSHGTLFLDKDGSIRQTVVMQDSDHSILSESTLSHRYIRDWLEALPSKKKVLIFATCHSGLGKSRLTETTQREISKHKGLAFLPMDQVSESSIILSAASFGETALEDDKLKHDIYTYFFLEALEKGDRNNDGAVVVSEAHDYAKDKTYQYTGGKQLPTFESKVMGMDNIVVAGIFNRKSLPVIYSYSGRFKGFDLYIDSVRKGQIPVGAAVEQGVHEIELRHPHAKAGDKPFAKKTIEIENTIIELSEIFHPPRNFLWAKLGRHYFYNSFQNTKLEFEAITGLGLGFGSEIYDPLDLQVLLNYFPKVTSTASFNGEVKTSYEAYDFGIGLNWRVLTMSDFQGNIFFNLLRNQITVTVGSGVDEYKFKSSDWELNSGVSFEWNIYEEAFLLLTIEHRYTNVTIALDEEKKYGRSLFGAATGIGWKF